MSGALITRYPGPHGYAAAIEGLGATAAPLLAGFAFALVGLTLDKESVLWCADLSLLLLVAAGLVLVLTVTMTYNARRNYISPSEYMAAREMAKLDSFDEDQLRRDQVNWIDRYNRWLDWIVPAFNLGTVLFLLAIASLLIPAEGPWDMSGLRVAAVALVFVAALAELLLPRVVERGNGGKSAPKEQAEPTGERG